MPIRQILAAAFLALAAAPAAAVTFQTPFTTFDGTPAGRMIFTVDPVEQIADVPNGALGVGTRFSLVTAIDIEVRLDPNTELRSTAGRSSTTLTQLLREEFAPSAFDAALATLTHFTLDRSDARDDGIGFTRGGNFVQEPVNDPRLIAGGAEFAWTFRGPLSGWEFVVQRGVLDFVVPGRQGVFFFGAPGETQLVPPPQVVPLPPAAMLLVGALAGLGYVSRRPV
jgi:hypothetical protein